MVAENACALKLAHIDAVHRQFLDRQTRNAFVSRHLIVPNVQSRNRYSARLTACGSLRISVGNSPWRTSVSISVSRNSIVRQRVKLRFRWRFRRIRSAARERGARFGETLGVARGSVILMSLRSSG